MSFFVTECGDTLIDGGKEISTSEALQDKKIIGIYFSAHWCPPCKRFTPKLAEWYKQHKDDYHLEIIFVSFDKSESDFKEYFDEMPWKALPFEQKEKKDDLGKKFRVSGIPKLVFVDKEGEPTKVDGKSEEEIKQIINSKSK